MAEAPGLELDLDSRVAPSEQIRAQVADLVRTGALRPGARLPAIRTLAADLGIAPGTVGKAYRELESAGLLVSAGRRGTVVAQAPPAPDAAEVGAAVGRAVALARTAGWDRERVELAVEQAWAATGPVR